MSFSIVKVYKESLLNVRFIGKKYGNKDRDNYGGFGSKWGEFHQNGWFCIIEKNTKILSDKYEGGAYLGLMCCKGDNFETDFEYWVGMFAEENSPVPDGFESVHIPAGDIATAWIYGREDNGEIYGGEPHNACMDKFAKQGWELQEAPYFFERYQCPRFTTNDGDGGVILDYCIYIK